MKNSNLAAEIIARVVLYIIYLTLEKVPPYETIIQPEEMWRYRYPRMTSYFPNYSLYVIVTLIPLATILIRKMQGDTDFREAMLAYTLAMCLASVVTMFIKIISGRLRPDFMWRCFPAGFGRHTTGLNCYGNRKTIREGRRSFPSGHSSLSFAGMTFLSLYLCGKLNIFNSKGRGNSLALLLCLLPILISTTIAISRVCDFHHHVSDVITGALCGSGFSFISYRQYYPSIFDSDCDAPYETTENE